MASITDNINALSQIKNNLRNILLDNDIEPGEDFSEYPDYLYDLFNQMDEITENIESGRKVQEPEIQVVVAAPRIRCENNFIYLESNYPDADYWYSLNGTLFNHYTVNFNIDRNAYVEAYYRVKINGKTYESQHAYEYCYYIAPVYPETPYFIRENGIMNIYTETEDAAIYYNIIEEDTVIQEYTLYSEPFQVSNNQTVSAYCVYTGNASNVSFDYAPGDTPVVYPDNPVISCENNTVTITCDTVGASIYYKIDNGEWTLYTSAININQTVEISAKSLLDEVYSEVVTETCTYITPVVTPAVPSISCVNNSVTITCDTVGATIYYKIDNGNYSQYTVPITINADCVITAYSSLNGIDSATASESVTYVVPIIEYNTQYLTFEVLEDGQFWFLYMWMDEESIDRHSNKRTIYYKIINGSWISLTAGCERHNDIVKISVNNGDIVKFKGTNSYYASTRNIIGEGQFRHIFMTTFSYNLYGNIMSLIYGDNFIGNNTLTHRDTFCRLFSLYAGGDTNSGKVLNTNNLILPATTLTEHCYREMFWICEHLLTAPELPATTLAENCYRDMFSGCTNLTTVPAILPATTLANDCYRGMFAGCDSLTTAPELPATTLAENCYQGMFQSCDSLTTAPELPATTLASYCYYWMFYGCDSLNYVKCLATDISANYCLNNWLSGVSATGTFVKNSSMNSWPTGDSGIPTGWTLTDAA